MYVFIMELKQIINQNAILVKMVNVYIWARFNIKMLCYQYRKSHCGDKTILLPSYLHNEISYTGKMTSLYWIRALKLQQCCSLIVGLSVIQVQ